MLAAAAVATTGINWGQVIAASGVIIAALGALGVWLDRRNKARTDEAAATAAQIQDAVEPSALLYTTKAEHAQTTHRVTALEARYELILGIVRGDFRARPWE